METLGKLGIDFQSMLLYLVNVGILWVIVAKFFVPPILKMLDKRQHAIASSINEANKLKDEFQVKMEQIEKEKKETHQKMRAEMENLTKALDEKKSELMAEAQAAKAKILADADKEVSQRKAQIVAEAEAQTLDTMKKVLSYIVNNRLPQDLVNQSVKEAWEAYRK